MQTKIQKQISKQKFWKTKIESAKESEVKNKIAEKSGK